MGTFVVGSSQQNLEFEAWQQAILATLSNPGLNGGIYVPVIRPLRAADLNTAYNDYFNGFVTNGTSNTASALTSSGFTTATGKAYAIFGFRDLTAGTKNVTAIQANVNGKSVPLQPIPLVQNWTDVNGTVFFSPIYALLPNQSFTLSLFDSTTTQTVNIQIVGYIAESAGNA